MKIPKQIINKLSDKNLKVGCRLKRRSDSTIIVMVSNVQWNGTKDEFHYYLEDFPNNIGAHRFIMELDEKAERAIAKDFEILGHPVYIGDILDGMEMNVAITRDIETLIELWKPCGISKSLQQIEEGSGYEELDCPSPDCVYGEEIHIDDEGEDAWGWCLTCKPNSGKVKRLKDPKVRELFNFLNTILND